MKTTFSISDFLTNQRKQKFYKIKLDGKPMPKNKQKKFLPLGKEAQGLEKQVHRARGWQDPVRTNSSVVLIHQANFFFFPKEGTVAHVGIKPQPCC